MIDNIENKSHIEIAFEIAEKTHKDQLDKAGKPYINHLIYISKNVKTQDARIVALLHDIYKFNKKYDIDTLREKLIGYGFNNNIIIALDALAKKKFENYDEYLMRIAKNPIAAKVKMESMKHNAMIERYDNPSDEDKKRCSKYKKRITKLNDCIAIQSSM